MPKLRMNTQNELRKKVFQNETEMLQFPRLGRTLPFSVRDVTCFPISGHSSWFLPGVAMHAGFSLQQNPRKEKSNVDGGCRASQTL